MKRKKYDSQLPKAWQKKKKSVIHTNERKRQKKLTLIHLKKQKHHLSGWRPQGVFFFAMVLVVILLVPTFIVVPYIHHDGGNEMAITDDRAQAQPKEEESQTPISVTVMRTNTNKTEDVPLETYVSRVVASEMPAKFDIEALKAQALAARTNIVNLMLHQKKKGKSNVTDTTDAQVYHNEDELREDMGSKFSHNMKKIKQATAATKGEILTYNGTPIFPAFFSTSNGYTENSEDYWSNKLPYLRSVKSPWDTKSPKFLDQEVFTIKQVNQKLGINATAKTPIHITRTKSHRVKQMTIADKTFTGKDVREKLGLRSSDFTIQQKNDHFIFKTKGFGHGIGMSQYGANGMAKEGDSYKDIVTYYYKGVKINDIQDVAPTLISNKEAM